MRQQINLYLPEFRPRHDWLDTVRVFQLLVLLVVLMGLISAVNYWQRQTLQQELALLQTELMEQTRRTEQIERSLASRATDQNLLREVTTRQANVAQLEQSLNTLRSSRLGNMSGFSEHMKNISRASFDGIWLEQIQLREGGTSAFLAGKAQHSAMVPNFVDRLTYGWSVAEGWRFTRMSGALTEASESSPQLYLFELETRR